MTRTETPKIDSWSPVMLEATLGLAGLRFLYELLNDADPDALLNQIENYYEETRGIPWDPGRTSATDLEELRETRERYDFTKPLGYYDQLGMARSDRPLSPDERCAVPVEDAEGLSERWSAFAGVLEEELDEDALAELHRLVEEDPEQLAKKLVAD